MTGPRSRPTGDACPSLLLAFWGRDSSRSESPESMTPGSSLASSPGGGILALPRPVAMSAAERSPQGGGSRL